MPLVDVTLAAECTVWLPTDVDAQAFRERLQARLDDVTEAMDGLAVEWAASSVWRAVVRQEAAATSDGSLTV